MYNKSLWEAFLFPPIHINKRRLEAKLKGKTILITGASSGIGEELAYQLGEIDCHLILVARTEEKLIRVKQEIEQKEAKVSIFRADLRDPEKVMELLKFIHQLPDGLDLFVSNAGLSIKRSINDSLDRYHDFTRTMAINYFAPVQLLLSLIPLLEKNKGHIINLSTINVLLLPVPHWAAYQASKSAFDTWFRAAASELNAMGIATSSVYLPLVKTPMILPTKEYQNLPAMSPEYVGKIIGKLIYTQRQKHRPWWLLPGQFASIIFRGVWEFAVPAILRKRK
ncbi:MAG TPA: SDR family NAD(P)-dependent oxidoreductase [Desulfitobacterium dehalogenans]|uniref:SDR family NAD(P)-dependent oxidoreductase n=1 Tax=Desulfitobacterium dehalogenans TaxID=36854 RepID=A0A7C7D6J1_9FIRM|nr:SDR family NAD(P)-dependent oxidoreductase [Desulfitobacterium dehalogenans]